MNQDDINPEQRRLVRHLLGVAGIVLGVLITGCASNDGIYSELASRYGATDPVEDARASFERGDRRVFSAMGVGQYYPGLESAAGKRMEERHGVVHLPHTSDIIESKAHYQYISTATEYARSYNRKMLALVSAEAD